MNETGDVHSSFCPFLLQSPSNQICILSYSADPELHELNPNSNASSIIVT